MGARMGVFTAQRPAVYRFALVRAIGRRFAAVARAKSLVGDVVGRCTASYTQLPLGRFDSVYSIPQLDISDTIKQLVCSVVTCPGWVHSHAKS